MDLLNLFRRPRNPLRLEAEEVLFDKGDVGECMFVVLEGELEVMLGTRVVERLGPGDVVGEMALIEKERRSARAVARTPCCLETLNRAQFLHLIQATPFFAIHMMRILAGRLRRTNDRVPSA